jgi:methyltransferase (TIGR00027 family)
MAADAAPARALAHRLQGRPSLTAEAVTMARALEHLKPEGERIVDDPYAQLFLSAPSRGVLRTWSGSLTSRVLRRLGASGTTYVPLRHRFIDDHLAAALDRGASQVVLLGAGYDARAYRFAAQLDGRPVFEVDLAAISRAKAAIVERNRSELPTTNVVRVEIDFEAQTLEEVLVDAGFEVGVHTFVTWEGVPMYLTRPAVTATLDALHALCGEGSVLAHDMWHLVDDPGLLGTARRLAPSLLSVIGEPVTFGIHPDEVGCFLERHGFELTEVVRSSELQARYAPGVTTLSDESVYVLAATRSP